MGMVALPKTLLQTPPANVLFKLIEAPTHTLDAPTIAVDVGWLKIFIVFFAVSTQLLAAVTMY